MTAESSGDARLGSIADDAAVLMSDHPQDLHFEKLGGGIE
jgi:hypothetical protein